MAKPRLSPHATGVLLALAGAITFSGKAIIVKLSYRYGVDAVTVIMVRMLWSLPMFMALAWWASRSTHAQENPLQWRDAPIIIALGVLGYYLASFLDFLGLQYISASLERLILYLNPTLVLLLSALIYKHRIRPMRALAMGVSYAGVLLVFGHEVSLAGPDAVTGALFVLGSALSYALYLMFSGEVVQRIGSMRLVGWASSVACVCCLLQYVSLRSLKYRHTRRSMVVGFAQCHGLYSGSCADGDVGHRAHRCCAHIANWHDWSPLDTGLGSVGVG